MKNTLIIVALITTFLFIYFLQSNFFIWFTIGGIQPNLFIILMLFIGLFGGKRLGIPLGITIGILLDFFISKKIGISAIMLALIGGLGGILDKNFSKDSKMTIIIMTIGSTIIYEIGMYAINTIILSSTIEITPFIKILSIEIIYNIIITILVYPIIQKAGYYIEDTFKSTKILTRYF
ncbi:MAG: rod shape-determining protein MreD [Clostridia bacterium]|nr:rod shape-determining protein MreD [Clostridia bacterium]